MRRRKKVNEYELNNIFNEMINNIDIIFDMLKEQPLMHPECEYENSTWVENRLKVINDKILKKGE